MIYTISYVAILMVKRQKTIRTPLILGLTRNRSSDHQHPSSLPCPFETTSRAISHRTHKSTTRQTRSSNNSARVRLRIRSISSTRTGGWLWARSRRCWLASSTFGPPMRSYLLSNIHNLTYTALSFQLKDLDEKTAQKASSVAPKPFKHALNICRLALPSSSSAPSGSLSQSPFITPSSSAAKSTRSPKTAFTIRSPSTQISFRSLASSIIEDVPQELIDWAGTVKELLKEEMLLHGVKGSNGRAFILDWINQDATVKGIFGWVMEAWGVRFISSSSGSQNTEVPLLIVLTVSLLCFADETDFRLPPKHEARRNPSSSRQTPPTPDRRRRQTSRRKTRQSLPLVPLPHDIPSFSLNSRFKTNHLHLQQHLFLQIPFYLFHYI
jgi:hypothetical protein